MGRHEVTHDRRVRIAGEVSDTEGCSVIVGVDYDTVSLHIRGSGVRLTAARAEEFAQIFVSACWAAARQQESMAGCDA